MAATRRNGQIASCEPCRKSKLRCDHSTPICDRCARRGKAELCVYHPAPLTRQKSPLGSEAAPRPSKRLQVEDQRPSTVAEKNSASAAQSPLGTFHQSPASTDVTGVRSYGSEGILRDQQIANWTRKRSSFSTPGFLGLTSYSAVFSENEGNLGVSTHGAAGVGSQDFPSIEVGSRVENDPRQVQLGAQLLLLLEDLDLYERIAETWFEVSEGCVIGTPIIRMMFNSLREAYNARITASTDRHSSMLAFSKKIFDNGLNPIEFNSSTTPKEFIDSISGENTKWEIVGLVFSIMGLGAVLASPWDSIFKREGKPVVDKKDLGIVATAAGDICLQFCDNSGIVNDPLSWLLFQHSHLLTLVYGDNDYRPWRRLGELSTVIFALGLHQSESDGKTPFFLGELRKRLMGGAYSMDKQLATFLGRPPRISWRYCDVQLPLDLSYEEIMAEPSVRDAAISKLDANGWNTGGSLAKAAWTRIALLTGYIREDILELSLSRRVEDLPRKVEEISQQSHKMWADLPEFLHWKPGMEAMAPAEYDDGLLMSLHLDYLYNDFLLYRILAKRTETRSEALIAISRDILSTLLVFVQSGSRSVRASCDIGWNVSYYGLPTAGVLAIELLRLSQPQPPPLPTPPTSSLSDRSSPTPFPRSEVIQNLSIFASHLQTVIQPHEGNYDICQQARKAIRHILDRVLSSSFEPGPPLSASQDAAGTDWLIGANNAGYGAPLDDGADFMKWIDNLDWGQEPWAGFS